MKKWTTLDEAVTPDGGKMTLRERDGVYVIFLNRYELMSTRMVESERQLAEFGCAKIKTRPKARVLIGGLGMGFTLRAVLEQLGEDATVVVAELMPEVIKWNQNPEYPLGYQPLQDKRVKLVNDDVVHVIQGAKDSFDATASPTAVASDNLALAGQRHPVAKLNRRALPRGVHECGDGEDRTAATERTQ